MRSTQTSQQILEVPTSAARRVVAVHECEIHVQSGLGYPFERRRQKLVLSPAWRHVREPPGGYLRLKCRSKACTMWLWALMRSRLPFLKVPPSMDI